LPASSAVPTSNESDETIFVSPPPAANAQDKGEPEPPTVIAQEGRRNTQVEPSIATERTRVPPPLDETTVLPAHPRTSDGSIKPPPVAPPPPPPPSSPPQSSPPIPIIVGGLVAVLILSGVVYYLANRLPSVTDDTKSSQPTSQIEPQVSEPIEDRQRADDERANREAELQKERERLAEDQRRMEEKQRQAEAQQAKETAERKQLEAERATSSRERELADQRAREEERKRQDAERLATERQHLDERPPRKKEVHLANTFPDQHLQSLLERFRQAYENHDLATIQNLSRMSDERIRNVHVMFEHYETIRASIKDLAQTDQGASATLFLDSVMTAKGEHVTLSPLARKFMLKISRQGAEWEKIIW
ncbi:MAG: hypothetical protein ABI604_18410, partial [Nitrospirota bacterium]